MNCKGQFFHRTPFCHNEFIISIIDTLSELDSNAWVPRSPDSNKLVGQEAHGIGSLMSEGDDDIVAKPKVEFPDEEAGGLPASSTNEASEENESPTGPDAPPKLLRFPVY